MGQDSKGLPALSLSFYFLYNSQRIAQRTLTVPFACLLTLWASWRNGGSECLVTCPWSLGKHIERTGLDPMSVGFKDSVYSTPASCLSTCLSSHFFILFFTEY